jgi:long-chain fatty acid transport protein
MRKRSSVVPAMIVSFAATPALASGFAFYENGAKASGQGGAWIARADDASANWYNPAALVHVAGGEVQFGLNYLDTGSDTQFSPAPGTSIDAVANTVTPAHFYFSQRVNDHVAWGMGLNTPFGLVSEWRDFPLSFSSRRAELRTYLINPNVAFKISNRWSLAIGADYLVAEVREFSRDALVGPFPTTADLTGEGDAWVYNFALQFKAEGFSLAGQYRSSLSPTIEGELTFTGVPGTFLNSAASAKVDLPGQTLLGAAWTGKRVDVEVGGYYTQWNSFKSLDVETGNPATSVSLTQDWEETWSYRLGIAFRLGQGMNHELRVGGVRDESPVPVEFLRPSIPDSDRTGYTLGYGFLAQSWGIDLYAMYIKFDDATATGSPADGVIPGTYTSTVLLAGVTVKYRF